MYVRLSVESPDIHHHLTESDKSAPYVPRRLYGMRKRQPKRGDVVHSVVWIKGSTGVRLVDVF